MTVRQGPVELGTADAAAVLRALATELRSTRIALGRSRRFVARKAGTSASRLARIESGGVRNPSMAVMCRVARVLGLAVSVRAFPAGSPVRDAGQLALLDRVERILGHPLRMDREIPLATGDRRAWDAAIVHGDARVFLEGEVRLGDMQDVHRRLALKLRDDPRSRVLILVVARTVHNRDVIARHREALRSLLPLDGPAILRALRAGRLPPASGVVLL